MPKLIAALFLLCSLASAQSRTLNPEAVYIVTPWSETGTIDSCVEEFLKMPVEIHLGPERILDRLMHARSFVNLEPVRMTMFPCLLLGLRLRPKSQVK